MYQNVPKKGTTIVSDVYTGKCTPTFRRYRLPSLWYIIKGGGSSEMSVHIYQSTRHHIAGDCYPHGQRSENVKSITLYERQKDGHRVAKTQTGNCSKVGYVSHVMHIID